MSPTNQLSEFLNYLVHSNLDVSNESDINSLPPISEISHELRISVASLREQLEVAKALGFVEVRPRTGIRRLPYHFTPAVNQSLSYSLAADKSYFEEFADLRNQIEAAYWLKAVTALTSEDKQNLQACINSAWSKLNGTPIQIPHAEHRDLHLMIYKRVNNIFVQGILEAYWNAYEEVGLNLYADYQYLQSVWGYHQNMVDSICSGEYEKGFTYLVEHKDLLHHRPDQIRINQPG